MRAQTLQLTTGSPTATLDWDSGYGCSIAVSTDGGVDLTWGGGSVSGTIASLTDGGYHEARPGGGATLSATLTSGSSATVLIGRTFK